MVVFLFGYYYFKTSLNLFCSYTNQLIVISNRTAISLKMPGPFRLGYSAFKVISEHITSSTVMITLATTGAYVMYNDYTRFPYMINAYKYGKLYSHSISEEHFEQYFCRPNEEKCLKEILSSKFCNQYYVIKGTVGSGKTRTITEAVKQCIADSSKLVGAPIYITSAEGKSFADTLAEAVNFNYDEHISLKFFIGALLGIESFPKHEESQKLRRVLDAIEESATRYAKAYGKPAVIVIDGMEYLSTHHPEAVVALQVKAKLWADSNIVKLIFVSNDEHTLSILQNNPGYWSRAGHMLSFDDLTKEQALKFLTRPTENGGDTKKQVCMDITLAEKIYSFVGGRLVHLLHCKNDWIAGISFIDMTKHLKNLEREKLLNAAKRPSVWKAIALLKCASCMPLVKLIQQTSKEDIDTLEAHHIIRIYQDDSGIFVCFESKIIENIISEFILNRS